MASRGPIGSSIVQAVLLAPLAIAVHRFVLLGETTSRYPLEPGSSRYLRFVGFAILVKILWLIPSTIESLIPGAENNPAVMAGLGIVVLALFIAVVIIVVRRVILFPAIAIDGPVRRGATPGSYQGNLLARGLHILPDGTAPFGRRRPALLFC